MAHRSAQDPRHATVHRHRSSFCCAAVLLLAGAALAEEVTVQNDTLVDFGTAAICPCFVTGERAAAWLTSPCDGDIVALQVFWRSFGGTAPDSLEAALHVYADGSFPVPGTNLLTRAGPLLTDDKMNEFRYSDAVGWTPIPVSAGETFVFALEFENINALTLGPSAVSDANGCKPNRNAIYAQDISGFVWVDACSQGVSGDWVLRAVVDCPAEVPIFTDGFESGDVTAWTDSLP